MSKKPETKRKKKSAPKPRLLDGKSRRDSKRIRYTDKQSTRLKAELEKLRSYLAEAEETLSAIRSGEVDALLVSKAGDEQVFTLKGADHAYRVLVEEMNEGAATLNSDGIIMYCNNSLASMLETPLEKVIGSSLRSHIAGDSLQSFDQFINRTLFESGKMEVNLRKENDKLIPALLSGRKLSLDNVTGISIVVTDISLQKQAQEILRRGHDELEKIVQERTSEVRIHHVELEMQNEELRVAQEELETSRKKYADLYNLAPIGYFSLDSKGIIKEANFAGCEMLGFDKYALLETPFSIYIPDSEDRSVFSSHQKEAFASHFRASCEIRLKRNDRTVFYAQLQSIALGNGPDKADYIRTAVVDITERKRMEEALRESEERYRGTFENAVVGIANVGLGGQWLTVNQKLCDIVGYTKDELLMTTFQAITHPDDVGADLEQLESLNRREINSYSREKRYIRKDGHDVWIALTVGAQKDETGRPLYYISVVQDITERKRMEEALRESEERYRTLSHATFEGIAISENGYLIEANEQFAVMHGYSPAEVLGKQIADFVGTEERENLLQALRRGAERVTEYRAIRKDGSAFFVEAHGKTVEEGERRLRVSAIRDITERKLAEEALHKNEERLREYVKLLEYAPVMVRNMNDEIILWNSGMARMYDYSPAEAVGRKYHDFLQTVFPLPLERILDTLSHTGRWEGELQHAKGDGGRIIVASLWVLHKNAEGKATAIIEIDSDITERRRAEEALVRLNEELEARVRERTNDLKKTINTLQTEIANRMEAEQQITRLAAAVESAADALVITEPERGIIQYVNPAFERITGYSRDEAVGRDLHMLESGRQGELFFRELRDTLKQDGVWTGRMVHKKKDGTLYEEECTYSPVKNASGEIINYISIKRDVTEKVRLESIAQAVDTMNNIGYIFAGVSHEIGNPINAIRITIDIMQRKLNILPKENVAEYLDRLMGQVQRVEYLLKGLKNFNMYESLQPNIIDMSSFLEAFLSMVKKDFEAKGIRIETVHQPDAKCVYADPRALQQVLLNILTNASDALQGREDPKIAIRVSASSGLARIQVKDNGRGIEETKLKDLFKPFYTTKKHGTGLGLVIIKKMMARMNGTVQITSRFNEGTVVELCLPCEKLETND